MTRTTVRGGRAVGTLLAALMVLSVATIGLTGGVAASDTSPASGNVTISGDIDSAATTLGASDDPRVILKQGGSVVDSTFADSNGNFAFHDVADADYTLVARADSHRDASQSVSVSGSDVTGLSFTLDGAVKNENSGTSYLSIQTAIDNAASGDRITVAPGTYNEALTVATDGLTIESTGGATRTTIWSNSGPVLTIDGANGGSTGVTIDGLTLAGGGSSVNKTVNTYNMQDLTVRNSVIDTRAGVAGSDGAKSGMYTDGAATIENVEFVETDDAGTGLWIDNPGTGSTVVDSEFTGYRVGLKISGTSDALVRGVDVRNIGVHGIIVLDSNSGNQVTIDRTDITRTDSNEGDKAVLLIQNSENVLVNNSEISYNGGSNTSRKANVANIQVFDGNSYDASTIEFANSNFRYNNYGLYTTEDSGSFSNEVQVHDSYFSNNQYGKASGKITIYNNASSKLDAGASSLTDVEGTITSGASDFSIANRGDARVRLVQSGTVVDRAVVAADGSYAFRNVSDGTYSIVAAGANHREASASVSVSGSDVTQDLTLGGAVQNVDTGNSFTSISAAINSGSVAAGNTITVAPGTYDEYLDAWNATDLTIESTGAMTETVLTGQGQGGTPTINAGSAADGLTVAGLTLQAAGSPSIVFNTYSMNTVGLRNSTVEATGSMTGVSVNEDATIVDNDVVSTSPDGIGVELRSSGGTGSTITDNEITGFGSGITATDADGLTISRNQIANNGDAAGEIGVSINVTSGTTIDGSTITVAQNNLVANNWGLATGGAGTVSNEVHAENNWWGSADGPGTNGANDVSGAVDYSPWLDAAAPDGVAVSTAISLTADDPVPNTEGKSAVYRTNVTFDQVGATDTAYVSVGFGTDTVDFSGVSASNVTLTDPSGTTLSVDNVQAVNATTLLVRPTSAIADPDAGSTYDLALENVTNPDSGSYDLTVGLHESGSAVNGNASVSFAGNTSGYAVSTASPPSISNFDASNPSGRDVQVAFDSDKPLDTIEVSISGAASAGLTTSDFSETDNGDGTYTYTATYAGSTDGDYTATLETAADSFGNDGASGESDTVTVSTVVGVGVSPETTSVEGGQTTTVDLVVSEAETGVGGFDLSIELTDDRRADITAVDIATDSAGNEADGKSISIADDGSSADIAATYLGDSVAPGSPTVVTVTLEGIATGPTNLTYAATSVTDGDGVEYDITGTNETELTITDTTAPTASAGSDTSVDEDTSVAFDGSASTDNVGIASYAWDFGDGSTATGRSPTHTFADPGTYTVTLTTTDGSGQTDSDTLTVDVADTTAPTADAGTDQVVPVGTAVNLDGTSSSDNTGIASYEWDFGDGTTATGETTSHAYDTAGTYTVTLTVTDDAGNTGTDTMTVTVEDQTAPTADAGSDQSVSVGGSATFDGSGSADNTGIASYEWDFGDGTTATGETASHAYDQPGSYTVTLTVTDTAGNTDSDTVTVDVTDVTEPAADAGVNRTAEVGTAVAFDGSGSADNVGVASYEWDFGDGTTATGETATHTYDETGTYTLTLTVTDGAGNTDTDTITVAVQESADTTAPTAEAGSEETVGLESTVEFDGSASSDNVGVTSYQWDFGDGSTGSGPTVSHSYDQPGTYTATLTVTDDAGNTDTDTLTVTVEDRTDPTATVGDDRTVEVGSTVDVDGSDSVDNVGIETYEWDFDDGATATGGTATHAYDETGTYTVTLTVTDDAGNTDTDTLTVTVEPADESTTPSDETTTSDQTTTPSGDTTTPGDETASPDDESGADETAPDGQSGTGSGPGFTLPLAVMGIALAALLVRRRQR